jgi:hypothetical protein
LKQRSRTTRFEIGGLVPGSTYYIKLVIVDIHGNESTVSIEATAISRKVAPYDVDTNQEWDTANLNPNFAIYTFPKTTTPPDHWFMGGSAVWGSADAQLYWNALTRSADLSLIYNGEVMPVLPVPQIVRFVVSEPFVVAEDWLHVVEFLWRHDGNTGNRTTWTPFVYFYAADKTTLIGAPLQPRDTRWLYSTSTPLTLAASTWWQDRGWVTPPAGARYAKLVLAIGIDDAFGQARHPAVIWDFFSCSRTLAKLIINGGASNRSITAAAGWVPPYLNAIPTIDNENAFLPGSPTPVIVNHSYIVQRPGEYALFARIAFTSMTDGAYILARLLCNGTQLDSSQFQYSIGNSQAFWIDVVIASAQLAAGDIITIEGRHTSGTAKLLDDSACRLSVTQLSNAKG